jgi:D-glycero-D-manno-heptose 1,7-bisphosphate phosphatase
VGGVRLADRWSLAIFDADDTLRRTLVPGQPCPRRHGEWQLLPGVRERLAREPWDDALRFAIASNQDQVGYGLVPLETARALLADLARAATGREADPRAIALCPHRIEEACGCRKPEPGMLTRLMNAFDVTPERTVFVGNAESDREAARRAGAAYLAADELFGW